MMREERLDDLVGRWHAGEGAGRALHEFLGWSLAEYAAWVENPSALPPERKGSA